MRSVAEFAKHARELAVAFKVQLVEDEKLALAASTAAPAVTGKHAPLINKILYDAGMAGAVQIPPIITEYCYAIALHEIGHCVAPGGIVPTVRGARSQSTNMKLYEEEQAWGWAIHYALEWTTEMEAARLYGLESYFIEARQQVRTRIVKTESLDEFLRRRKR